MWRADYHRWLRKERELDSTDIFFKWLKTEPLDFIELEVDESTILNGLAQRFHDVRPQFRNEHEPRRQRASFMTNVQTKSCMVCNLNHSIQTCPTLGV